MRKIQIGIMGSAADLKYSEDEHNIFVPRGVAEVSPFLKKEIYQIVHQGN